MVTARMARRDRGREIPGLACSPLARLNAGARPFTNSRIQHVRILVCGAAGFIGVHLAASLVHDGHEVVGVDRRQPRFGPVPGLRLIRADLRDPAVLGPILGEGFDEVYQLAADMGGAGYLFTGDNDARVMHNSATINLNVVNAAAAAKTPPRLFFSSSACIYPRRDQTAPDNPGCAEQSAYPADPDSEYGWEKLFSERLYTAFARNHGLTVRIARYHNIFGTLCSWNDGREKAPAALARKVAEAPDGGEIDIWGDGKQTRSFLHVGECVEGTKRLMRSDCAEPLNIGSEEMVSIEDLANRFIAISGKSLAIRNVPGPQGVRGRNSDNRLIREKLGWSPSRPLTEGLRELYSWIEEQVETASAPTP